MGGMDKKRTVEVLPLEARVAALAQLGQVMLAIGEKRSWPGHASGLNESEYARLDDLVLRAQSVNGWATEENVRFAMRAWGKVLAKDAIQLWVAAYPNLVENDRAARTIGLVLAGNIPLVGLHDVICVWLSGHRAVVKCSSQDPELIPALIRTLDQFAPGAAVQMTFTTEKWGSVDAVIATGSNNSARYFEHYFGHLPTIVRKSRVSVAVLDGTESAEDLAALSEDVLRYFGLGCRNVSKLYLPKDFVLDRLFEAFFPWSGIANNNKYANNYDYTRAIWLLDKVQFLDNGFVLLKEDEALTSPVGTVFYERYTDHAEVEKKITEHADRIQCVVGKGHLEFGTTQQPGLADYADGVDTLAFLLGQN